MPNYTLNASSLLAPPPGHMAVVRADLATDSQAALQDGLRRLTLLLQEFLHGLDRPRHRVADPADRRGWGQNAMVGFGPFFFRRRASSRLRFGFRAVPADLRPLALEWDWRHGLDPAKLQADLVVVLEAENRTLLVDGLEQVLSHADTGGWVTVRDVHEGTRRGDGRNSLGFYDGTRNAGRPGMPGIGEVAYVDRREEPPGLGGGSYMVFRKYLFDMTRWGRLSRNEQEALVGQDRETGAQIGEGEATAAHSNAMRQHDGRWIYRRGIGFARLQADGSVQRGLLFLSFQRNQSLFERLYNRSPDVRHIPDALLTHPAIRAQNADSYFVPDHGTWQWGFIGQSFFAPEPVELNIVGGLALADGDFRRAERYFLEIARRHPDHMLGYTEPANLYGESGDVRRALHWSQRARQIAPNNYLTLSALAWAEYLAGQYEFAARHAEAAVECCYADDYRGFPYHTLAAASLMLGAYGPAEQAAIRSVRRLPDEPLILFTFATVLDVQGRRGEARRHYARVVEIVADAVAAGTAVGLGRVTGYRIDRIAFRSDLADETRRAVTALLVRAAPDPSRPPPGAELSHSY